MSHLCAWQDHGAGPPEGPTKAQEIGWMAAFRELQATAQCPNGD